MSTLINLSSNSSPYTTIGGLFAQTANSVPVTNTLTELSLIGSGQGSLSVPANGFKVGDSFSVTMWGHINSKNNDALRIRVKSGAVVLADTGLITMPQCTVKHWNLEVRFTIRAIGVATVASICSAAQFTYTKDASNAFEGGDSTIIENTTFNTTIPNALDITAQWNAADPLNNIFSECFILTKIY